MLWYSNYKLFKLVLFPEIELSTIKIPANRILSKTEASITVKLVHISDVDVYR